MRYVYCSLMQNRLNHLNVASSLSCNEPSLSELMDDIAKDGHGLIMLMGKGGVGKTTIAAAVAVELAHRGVAGASHHL